MRPVHRDAVQRASDVSALTLTAVMICTVVATRPTLRSQEAAAERNARQSSIELSLESPPAESPSAPARPEPEPQMSHTRRTRPKPVRAAAAPVPTESVLAETEAVPADASLIGTSEATSAAALQPARSQPDLDAQYAAGVRSDIDRRTQVPDSARYRLHHPSGEVRVGFVLTRAGEPKAVTLRRSSGSEILDEAALTIVASGHYPPMPENVYLGEAEHVFAVTIEFRAASRALRES